MAMFVRLEVDADLCAREPQCRECVQSCPVDIFVRNDGDTAHSIPDNEDECILCDQCVERCTGRACLGMAPHRCALLLEQSPASKSAPTLVCRTPQVIIWPRRYLTRRVAS